MKRKKETLLRRPPPNRRKGRQLPARKRLRQFRNRSSNITIGKLFKTNKDGYNTSEVCGKTAFASVDVATKKLELLDKVMAKSAAICGDAITINSPVYLYSKIEDLKLNLLAKATGKRKVARADARKRGRRKARQHNVGNAGRFPDNRAAFNRNRVLRHVRHFHNRKRRAVPS